MTSTRIDARDSTAFHIHFSEGAKRGKLPKDLSVTAAMRDGECVLRVIDKSGNCYATLSVKQENLDAFFNNDADETAAGLATITGRKDVLASDEVKSALRNLIRSTADYKQTTAKAPVFCDDSGVKLPQARGVDFVRQLQKIGIDTGWLPATKGDGERSTADGLFGSQTRELAARFFTEGGPFGANAAAQYEKFYATLSPEDRKALPKPGPEAPTFEDGNVWSAPKLVAFLRANKGEILPKPKEAAAPAEEPEKPLAPAAPTEEQPAAEPAAAQTKPATSARSLETIKQHLLAWANADDLRQLPAKEVAADLVALNAAIVTARENGEDVPSLVALRDQVFDKVEALFVQTATLHPEQVRAYLREVGKQDVTVAGNLQRGLLTRIGGRDLKADEVIPFELCANPEYMAAVAPDATAFGEFEKALTRGWVTLRERQAALGGALALLQSGAPLSNETRDQALHLSANLALKTGKRLRDITADDGLKVAIALWMRPSTPTRDGYLADVAKLSLTSAHDPHAQTALSKRIDFELTKALSEDAHEAAALVTTIADAAGPEAAGACVGRVLEELRKKEGLSAGRAFQDAVWRAPSSHKKGAPPFSKNEAFTHAVFPTGSVAEFQARTGSADTKTGYMKQVYETWLKTLPSTEQVAV